MRAVICLLQVFFRLGHGFLHVYRIFGSLEIRTFFLNLFFDIGCSILIMGSYGGFCYFILADTWGVEGRVRLLF